MNHYYEFETLTRVRVLLAQSDLAQAEAVLTQLRPVAEAEERLSSSIEIDLLWALVAQAQGAFEQALDFLAQAVTTAHLVGYVRGFVDEGTPMRALLARLRERQRRGSMLRRACDTLLTAFDSSSPVVAPMRATAQPVEALSEREREVLHLLAQGRSNQEIARHLVVAVSTVKTHLHHIFAKLQTTDRLRAVTRARELGLLA